MCVWTLEVVRVQCVYVCVCALVVEVHVAGRAGPWRDAPADRFRCAEGAERRPDGDVLHARAHTGSRLDAPRGNATGGVPGSEMYVSASRSPPERVVLVEFKGRGKENVRGRRRQLEPRPPDDDEPRRNCGEGKLEPVAASRPERAKIIKTLL